MKPKSKRATKGASPRRGQRKHDWLQLENGFLSTPHGDLTRYARDVGVPVGTLFRKSCPGNWRAKWEDVQKQALERALETTVEDRAEKISRMNRQHFEDAELLRSGVAAFIATRISQGVLLFDPLEAKAIAETLGKLQAQQRIALGMATEKQSRELSGPEGGPIPVTTLSIQVVQSRESPEPPNEPDSTDDRDDA